MVRASLERSNRTTSKAIRIAKDEEDGRLCMALARLTSWDRRRTLGENLSVH